MEPHLGILLDQKIRGKKRKQGSVAVFPNFPNGQLVSVPNRVVRFPQGPISMMSLPENLESKRLKIFCEPINMQSLFQFSFVFVIL